jgi:YfiR/HmsC-like
VSSSAFSFDSPFVLSRLRRLTGLLLGCAAAFASAAARADELPTTMQAQLLSKVSTYVVGLTNAGEPPLKVVVLHPGSAAAPSRGAQALSQALAAVGSFGKRKVDTKPLALGDAKKLQALLQAEKPGLVFLAPELDDAAVKAIVDACNEPRILTVTGTDSHVRRGVILGFALVEARPRVLVNLKRANEQGVKFHSGLLPNAVIVEK